MSGRLRHILEVMTLDELAHSAHLTGAQWHLIAETLTLAPRQLQIVQAVFDGLDERHMATELGIAKGTIHTYTQRLYQKLGVNCRCELIVRVFLAYLSAERGETPTAAPTKPDTLPEAP